MSDETNGNGAAEEKKPPAYIVLTLSVDPWHLDIKATVENMDAALAALDQAKRYFEQQLRIQAAAQFQQQAADAARTQQILNQVKGRA